MTSPPNESASPLTPPCSPVSQQREVIPTLAQLKAGRKVDFMDNTEALLKEHLSVTNGVPYFRFPPEPNGYLHIGHAKSMNLNFGGAAVHKGKCYLRFDDTNPECENDEYIDGIMEMMQWMGWQPDKITFSSDYFDRLHDCAMTLIEEGKAYVDHSTGEEVKKQREQRTESSYRNRSVAENKKHFLYMKQGRYAEGEATLRLKMDMTHDNANMRDLIAYRVKYHAHPRVKDKWCVYPSYDFTHCLCDSFEHVDFSLCTLEFETRRESYYWLIAQLNLFRPSVWEFSRLNVTGTLLSKRKINALVSQKIVRGFDDPRLMTLVGMRRRGYTPAAITKFVGLLGITRNQNVIEMKMLENTLREELDEIAPRKLGVLQPLKIQITNWKGEKSCDASNHPRYVYRGSRGLKFTESLYIDASDFRDVDPGSKYYGLAPGKSVGLKYGGNLECQGFDKDEKTGQLKVVYCTIDFEKKNKVKSHIGWVSEKYAVPVQIRHYTPLLTDDRAATDSDFFQYIDEESETVLHGFIEDSVPPGTAVSTTFQLERFGFYTIDKDSAASCLVLNRVIALQQDKDKTK